MVTALEVIALEESGFSIGFSITLKDCNEEKKSFSQLVLVLSLQE